jgi:hypothetical protein
MLKVDLSSLRETKPHEYAMRFVFGGVCTVLAGLIAKRFGPTIGGLFLAFPAIFPAGASLIEDHEKKRKAEHGYDGTVRGQRRCGRRIPRLRRSHGIRHNPLERDTRPQCILGHFISNVCLDRPVNDSLGTAEEAIVSSSTEITMKKFGRFVQSPPPQLLGMSL